MSQFLLLASVVCDGAMVATIEDLLNVLDPHAFVSLNLLPYDFLLLGSPRFARSFLTYALKYQEIVKLALIHVGVCQIQYMFMILCGVSVHI